MIVFSKLMLNDFADVMKEKNITVTFTDGVIEQLAKISEGAKAGARELRSNIRKFIEDKAVDTIINNCDKALTEMNFDYKKEFTINFK